MRSFEDFTAIDRERLLALAQASKVKPKSTPELPITPIDRDHPLELSFAQQRLWFLAQFRGASEAYNMPSGFRLIGDLNREALRLALDRIVARHESLRATFSQIDGRPIQIIGSAEAGFHLQEHDLRHAADAAAELRRLALREVAQPFDLERGPLIRGQLVQIAVDDHALLLTMHHIVSDGWSMGVLIDELSALYKAYCRGEAVPLPDLPIQYADYAAWQRRWLSGDVLRRQSEYWKNTLAGAPALLELPTDRARPAQQDYAGDIVEVELEAGLTRKLKALSQRHGSTLYMTLLAGWAALLARLSGQDEVVIGMPMANRMRAEIEPLIGFFINTLPLRIDVSGSPTVAELLAQVRARALEAQQNQDIPFEQVVEIAQIPRSLAHAPLFQSAFAWQSAPEGGLDLPGLAVTPMSSPHVTAQFDFSLSLQEAGGQITGGLEYATALFDRATAERYYGHWRMLLEGMVEDEAQAIDRLPLLGQDERRQVLAEWNATQVDYPKEKCVHELFEAQVEKSPEAIALVHEGQSLTYGELNARANRLAHYLGELGVLPEMRVALFLERSIELVVAELAVLKCGAAYAPIDPTFPAERQLLMATDCEAQVAIAIRNTSLPEGFQVSRVNIDDLHGVEAEVGNLNLPIGSETTAYVMYTSGSTGRPKGVIVPHRAIGRLVLNCGYADFNAGDRVAFAANPAFDAATMEVWAPLLNGGRTVVIDQDCLLEPMKFVKALRQHEISVLWLTAGLFNQYADTLTEALARLRYLIVGGDVLDPQIIAGIVAGSRPQYLVNGYGPTETTTFAITEKIKEVPEGVRSIPLGRPISNTQIYILESKQQPSPIGVAGELYIGGAGVARGYLNRPDLTAESFLPDPFGSEPGARFYKTGDLGRWLPDGRIEFLGRNDFQVKIRGFRVELGEIEAKLAGRAGVREVVVVAREDGEAGKRLVAYYTGEEIGAEALRAHLSSGLPEYMVPAAYVRLESLPLAPNGKLDRRALPAPEGEAYVRRGYEPPVGETETRLAQIWSELLRLERVGRNDNFFELGGHSLLAVRALSQLRQSLGVETSLSTLFARPLLSDFARMVERSAQSELPPITPVDRNNSLELSFAQQRLWFLAQFQGASEAYHIAGGLRLKGDLDRMALLRSLDRIVARHESLRATFSQIDGRPIQIIGSAEAGFHLQEHDLRQMSDADAELRRLAVSEATQLFDLERGPLVRGRLVQIADDDHALLLTMHHIVSDGWSMGVLIDELSALYKAYCRGEASPLPDLPIQYADYAAWQRRWLSGDVLRRQSEYWKNTLAGAPALLELPADRARPAHQDYAGDIVKVELEAGLTRKLKALSQRHGATLYMTLLAGWGALLARLSGQDEVMIGTPVANRMRAEIEPLIGFFINTLPLRIDVTGSPTVAELLERVKARALEAQQNQDIPLEQVVEIAQIPRNLAHAPLFQSAFAWQNTPEGRLDLPGLTVTPMSSPHVTAQFDFSLSLQEVGGQIRGGLEYATALFDRATAERYYGHWRMLLEGMVEDEAQAIDRLPLLGQDERRQVLVEWNATQEDYPKEKYVHELFEEQVEKRPEAVALAHEEQSLTYGDLNARANRLAHYLRELGVGPDARVAICVERGMDMVTAVLATLKAGGAYLPLDTTYPLERLGYMLEDSAPAVLLTNDAAGGVLAGYSHTIPTLNLDSDASLWAGKSEHNPDHIEIDPRARRLAYVIYTSGSTGQPKGVTVEHRGVCNSALAHRSLAADSDSRILQFASFSFDVCVFELTLALCNGALLVLPPRGLTMAGEALVQTINRHSISHILLAPSVLATVPLGADLDSVRILMIGIEAITREQVQRWLPGRRMINGYGPTEATIWATQHECRVDYLGVPPIGGPIVNTRAYIFDANHQPVPIGVIGEIYIGGNGVARGYLNRPELTAERFLPDPFNQEPGTRIYKTGDLGRWLPNGEVGFQGRSDFQVKIRGFRVELGEIETKMTSHPEVSEAVVIARDGDSGKRLVAYYVGGDVSAEALRDHLSLNLPPYMVPSAYVQLDALPLTPNGKLDRQALLNREDQAYSTCGYEAPVGETEIRLARIWADALQIERVGRNDNFFELGGHSLLAVTVIELMRREGLQADMQALFTMPTLRALAEVISGESEIEVETPPNLIPPDCQSITPEMLPLVDLTQSEIDGIVANVPGGAANVKDIYPLAPLQEGLLFHHIVTVEGDVYLYPTLLAFNTRGRLEAFIESLQAVIARHDILRTAIAWEGLPEPVQVVWREAPLPIEEVTLDPSGVEATQQLRSRYNPRRIRIKVNQAPLMRCVAAHDAANERWLLLWLSHHLAIDHTTLDIMMQETQAHMLGEADRLPEPLPFRNYVAKVRLGIDQAEHEAFFREMLADVEEPTAPFGLIEAQGDGTDVAVAEVELDTIFAGRLRERARALGVSMASVCHLAWAQVLARVSGRNDVVFGTVLFGRMHGGPAVDRTLGLFINTLPIRIRVGEEEVEQAVRQLHSLLAGLMRHEHASLALAQRASSVVAPMPLFSSLLNYRYSPREATASPETEPAWAGIEWLDTEERTNYPLGLAVDDLGDGIALTAQTVAPIDPMRVCNFMRTALEGLVEALESEPITTVSRLDVLPEAEHRQVVEEWNQTQAAFPSERCIHELFQEQVTRTPQAVAVIHEDRQLTYAQLNTQANRLAHFLRELGVKPDARVAICVERGIEMVVGLLAILKAGGAYVPLDPAYPPERLSFMLGDSAPSVVLTQGAFAGLLTGVSPTLPVIDLAIEAPPWEDQPESNPDRHSVGLRPEHLAYVIYTSGSTGLPKGAMNEHRAVVNRLIWMQRAYGLDLHDSVFQKTPFSFDVSVWEFFWPLMFGARLVMARPEGHKDPAYLIETIRRENITTMHFVPSMLQAFLERAEVTNCSNLVRVICSGENLPAALARRFQTLLPGTELHNLYGPTEAAVDVTAWACPPNVSKTGIPIGAPIANTRIYILDIDGRPAPIGVAGEIYIGGVQVGRGYLNRPELTAERFIPMRNAECGMRNGGHSTDRDSAFRIYKTGDLGKWLPDGTIEFLGRNDFQVKMRGFRIELGEIEARLREHPEVGEAVVMAREDNPGDQRLVAYYTGADISEGQVPVGAEELRRRLSTSLPEYMVPGAYVRLEALPLTPNGKLDRKALPPPEADGYVVRGYAAPEGEVETILAGIWAEVLKVERVGRHDNFFELGGHSLLAVTLIERMRRNGAQADVRALFTSPTLAGLAEAVGGRTNIVEAPPNRIPSQCEAITPEMLPLVKLTTAEIENIVSGVPGRAANVQDIYPLAPLQEGILFHHLMGTKGDTYLLSSLFSFDTGARLEGYLGFLQRVLDRHDILRTAVAWEGLSEPVQVVWRQAPLPVEEVKLDAATGDAAEQLYARFDPRRYRIDVRQAPMMRAYIAHDTINGRWLLLLLLHHLAGDHVTLEVMQEEIQAHLLGQSDQLPTPQPFRNFVAQARLGVSREEHEAFFRRLLGEVDEPTAPFGLLDAQVDGAEIAEARREVDARVAHRLRERVRRLGVSAASVCHLAWAQALARVSGRDDVVFGTVLFGRMQGGEGADRVMGLFINTLPVRIRVGEEGVEASVRRTHTLLADLLRHEHASLALAQRCSAVPAPAPLFSALLNYRHSQGLVQARSAEAIQAEEGIEALYGEERNNYPVTLSVDDLGEGFVLTAQVEAPVDPMRVCNLMHTALEGLVEALEKAPTTAVSRLDVLPEAERRQVIEEWNETGREIPQATLPELFEEQVRKTPGAVAVVYDEQELSYEELNERANRLAHLLIDEGVGPEDLVALAMPRSLEMIISLLAVLKAGAAYLPISPDDPAERVELILADAEPAFALTTANAATGLPKSSAFKILDHPETVGDLARSATRNPTDLDRKSPLRPANPAYVIYTSGSTGKPKGVVVTHQNVVRLFGATEHWFEFGEDDVWTLFHSYAFDFSVWEAWGALLYGGRLVVAPYLITRSPAEFLRFLVRNGVTVLNQTPSAFYQLMQAEQEAPDLGRSLALRNVIFGGEALELWRLRDWYQRHAEHSPRLINMYGITETTVHVSYMALDQSAIKSAYSLIGRGIPDLRVYVLDTSMRPAPVGVVGELYVAGTGLSRGYLQRPALTAERFLADPYGEPGARMYRTGDLARWRQDGTLEFFGRSDQQVKIRGFRVELGEIEAVLEQHPGVQEAVVLAEDYGPDDKRLIAYCVPDQQHSFTVRQFLRLERQGPLSGKYELPNSMVIVHKNKGETDFMYQEIFEERTYAQHGITLEDGACIFDVGANIGLFSLFAGRACGNAMIYAFEPIPAVFEMLRLNADLYGLNVKLFNCGLSDAPKSEVITYYPNISVVSGVYADDLQQREIIKSFLHNQERLGAGERSLSNGSLLDELLEERLVNERITCQFKTISDVIRENNVERIDLLKIDVEKSELDVLAGIQEDDWKKIRQCVVEVHDIDGRLEQVTSLFKRNGYEVAVQQDAVLKNTGLYNVYAVMVSERRGPAREARGKLNGRSTPTWHSQGELISDVRRFLTSKLPDYMAPAAIAMLETMPLTPNGKLDRKALPSPEGHARKYEPPIGETETRLSRIWADALKLERVGRHDNFFELGGHSLLAMKVIDRMRLEGLPADVSTLFTSPTLAELAAATEDLEIRL